MTDTDLEEALYDFDALFGPAPPEPPSVPTPPITYEEFIADWSKEHGGNVLQTCAAATQLMVQVCEGLTRIRGHVIMLTPPDGDTSKWPHWWCVDEEGTIVDPTAAQFPSALQYLPLDESLGQPTGKCPNCGELCYDRNYMCSDACHEDYVAYLKESTKPQY